MVSAEAQIEVLPPQVSINGTRRVQ